MAVKINSVLPGLYIIPGLVNVYLLETVNGDALIDTGFPGSADKILAALKSIGKTPQDVRHILLTHAHPDHVGSAAALKQATGATIYAHAIDAPLIEGTAPRRAGYAAPGLRNYLMTKILLSTLPKVEPTKVDSLVAAEEKLPFADDVVAIHAPGHCAGQVALLWNRHGGVLFTADACINRGGLQLTAAVEDLETTRRTLTKISALDFEVACFGHGPPIMHGASLAFRNIWPPMAA